MLMSHDLLSCLCGQLENEVAKVLFTAFYPPIQKGTPSTGWLYFGDVKKKKKKKPMVCMSCIINHTQLVWIYPG